jgi:two-component system, sensor histidine kinase PdtaS
LSLRSLRGRLAVLLGLAFLPAGAVAVQAGLAAEAERRASIQQSIGATELAALSVVRDEAIQMRELARSLAANVDLFADNRTRCQSTLERLGEQYPDIALLSVLDSERNVVCADERGLLGRQLGSDMLLSEAQERGAAVVRFSVEDAALAAVAPAAVGRREDERLFVSVMLPASYLLGRVESIMPDRFELLIDSTGEALASQGIDLAGERGSSVQQLLRTTSLSTLSTAQRVGQTWLVVAPLEAGGLYIAHGWRQPPPTALEHLRSAWTLLAPILLWLAAVGAAWYAIEIFVARPLFTVERLARAYARGEDSIGEEEALLSAPTEIRSLRRTLAAMAKTLRGREARIAEALQEERALLREVHHRVKNNLQMVASILSIQARSSTDESEARGLARAKDRVQMLALAHARIYSSGEVREIALDQLAADIARQLVAGRGAAASQLRLEMVFDPVRADVDRAVAFAFMIGESVSNAIDVALASRSLELRLTLGVRDDGSLEFEVSSSRPPVGRAHAAPAAERLVDAFASQLGARVERDAADPALTRIIVPPESESAPVLLERSPEAPAVRQGEIARGS